MLFVPPASSRFIRLHGPYISEQESAISQATSQTRQLTDDRITADQKTAADKIEMDKDDQYTGCPHRAERPAFDFLLQRRLRIGFSRAVRLVDMMEMEGLVSPPPPAPRGSLDKHYFDAVDQQLR
jgi:S-DNA-T family DNA segregation ATPase FtsK/SpoIIIE